MSIRLSRSAALAALLAAALGVSGCGSDSSDGGKLSTGKVSAKAKAAPAIGAGDAAPVQESLLGDDATGATASAGTDESYEPEGEIIADSGFRPEVDGFGFENYGNDVEPQNLTSAEIQSLFGDDVCVGGDGDDCTLIPPAKRWMDNENARMNGGHCMGFSVAAIRIFEENLALADFGDVGQTSELEIQGNVDLQSSIAEHWVYQDLPRIQRKTVEGTPTEIMETLADALNSGDEGYTIGIFMADGTGGHAITPFAIEDKGDGLYAILVYDNNFPGITRAMDVDLNEDTWQYVGGTNPKDLDEVYQGDAETQSMMLLPTSPGEQTQPCPFCDGEEASDEEGLGSAKSGGDYVEITLGGAVTNHPHLVFTDEKGRQTGIVDGELKKEIPGVEVVQTFAVRNWEASPEPKFQIKPGLDIGMTIDGSKLKKRAKAKIDLVGGGLVVAIDEISLDPGQQDNVFISGDGYGLYYENNGTRDETPEFFAGVVDGETAYTFAATAVGVKKGSTLGILVDRESGTVLLDAEGTKGQLEGKAYFALAVVKQTATAQRSWLADDLLLSGKDGVYFNYKDTPKAGQPLELEVGPENGPFKTVKARYDS